MTNRPEFLSATFGIAPAGGVVTTFSTFSTAAELDHLVEVSGIAVLLLEAQVLKKNFAGVLAEPDPAIAGGEAGAIASTRFPYLTVVAVIGDASAAIEPWDQFLACGAGVAQARVDARVAQTRPADPGMQFFPRVRPPSPRASFRRIAGSRSSSGVVPNGTRPSRASSGCGRPTAFSGQAISRWHWGAR